MPKAEWEISWKDHPRELLILTQVVWSAERTRTTLLLIRAPIFDLGGIRMLEVAYTFPVHTA